MFNIGKFVHFLLCQLDLNRIKIFSRISLLLCIFVPPFVARRFQPAGPSAHGVSQFFFIIAHLTYDLNCIVSYI